MRRTKEQAAETGRQVLAAAEDLFLEKGYDNVSLEEIAVAAGVTRGAVHWHYKNKQGLVEALRDAVREPFTNLADALSQSEGKATLDDLAHVVAKMFEGLDSDPRQRGLCLVIMRLDITKASVPGSRGSTFQSGMRETLLRIFRAVDRDSGLAADWPPGKAAATFSAAIGGLVMEWALGPPDLKLSADGSDLIKTILGSWRR